MCLQCISFMIEVTLPRTISLNERCTLLSHALSLTRTHPPGQFVFISPSNNSPSIPPAAHFHMQPTTNPFERVQSFLDDRSSPTSFLPCFAQGNVSARDL